MTRNKTDTCIYHFAVTKKRRTKGQPRKWGVQKNDRGLRCVWILWRNDRIEADAHFVYKKIETRRFTAAGFFESINLAIDGKGKVEVDAHFVYTKIETRSLITAGLFKLRNLAIDSKGKIEVDAHFVYTKIETRSLITAVDVKSKRLVIDRQKYKK